MAKSVTMYLSGSEDTATGNGGFQVTAGNILTVFGNKIKVEGKHIDVGIKLKKAGMEGKTKIIKIMMPLTRFRIWHHYHKYTFGGIPFKHHLFQYFF